MICSKQDISNVASAISYFEKRKMNVSLVPMPVQQNDGIKMTYAFIMPIDRKVVKKNKKSISNNKYILFNSWYTKTKMPNWPTSPVMWNNMKQLSQVKPFVGLFDYMEKLGKTIKKEVAATIAEQNKINRQLQTNDEENISDENKDKTTDKAENGKSEQEQQVELFNAKRAELYLEFYKVLNAAFHHGSAPSNSSIYDIKLPKVIGISGQYEKNEFDRLTRNIVQNAVETFKSFLQSSFGDEDIVLSTVKTAATSASPKTISSRSNSMMSNSSNSSSSNNRKRRAAVSQIGGGSAASKHQRTSGKHRRDSYNMVDDEMDESQMSSN
ncbi:39K [Rachiplusia nu nucleopolyhedrovirus]|uniref:39K n=1 Tax=Rachiplusia nu nucleopolyhedrovirus TaxID=2605775 RepID=A0AAE6ISA3_9ABAC|nr:39K [Rachiplusia nu nucleopolyhedrovirus]QEI03650.1 39K [Rachiplusia nu nucleopolyhedrovirus]